ncbi:I78 family peptidase inhibitor [Tropicimonas sp. TH_r6]|uniref:I78 family peptidase inhibitor n=1 Tax=Tropicimonas sp. TH_r6 TaxID=3082085 RepID=UPI002953305F|nr:I78 family peptidase inhibitor [Tropicimonas sp. TH_r6]MDV7144729.1 I78 family peptidase inhibitor [Tropicimonas sp. TH_r6]
MKARILLISALALALAGCTDTTSNPVSEEMFISEPTPTVASTLPPAATTETVIGPDGQAIDPALALVEEDPFSQTIEGGADGLTERLPDTCKLELYQGYTGQTQAEIDAAGLGVSYRIVPKGSIVTQEYQPLRVNFYLDGSGKVYQIACG